MNILDFKKMNILFDPDSISRVVGGQIITVVHGGGGSLRTPKSYFEVYVRPLKKEQAELFKSHQLLLALTKAFN